MLKSLLLTVSLWCLFQNILFAAEAHHKIEILAQSVQATKERIVAKDGVIVYYNDAVIKADHASYDKNRNLLVLEGDVELIGYQGSKERTERMEIETKQNKVTFENLFLASDNDIWAYTKTAQRQDGNYTLGDTILSSCEINDPLWAIRFSHADYDSTQKYMRIRGAKVYFLDFPIFYFPYLAFSTNRERTSGLLFPLFGYSATEGFVYEQPLFWAIDPSMDLELNPQIRTSRSIGMYGTFRFADSAVSHGAIRMGYFRDKKSYLIAQQQDQRDHYGFELNYLSSNFLRDYKPAGYTDGLYVNMTLLNDIDYLNLQKGTLDHFGLTPLQESRLNYFLHDETYYYGLNAKYFIDTRKQSNEDTLQILPSMQFHKYLNHFIWKNLTYSFDAKFNHYDRRVGARLNQVEMRLPLEYTFSLFDDYLNFSFGEEFYYSRFFFDNGNFAHNTFQYYSNIHKIKLFTDLTKGYEGFRHVLQPSLTYLYPGNESEQPISFSLLDDGQKELFTVGLPKEQYQFALSQYFFDESSDLIFYQRLFQNYYVEGPLHFSDLGNEMQYHWNQWTLYNDLVYSVEYGKIRRSSISLSSHNGEYDFTLGHSYKQVLPDRPDDVGANDLLFDFSYRWNEKVDLYGGFSYSINATSSTQWRFGGKYTRNCWSVAASVREEIVPRPTGYTRENNFYVQLNFIPFGGVGTGE
jgi:LPS-assembly protein